MLIPNHPDDERLAALAGADPDAAGDAALVAHVDACERCASLTDELRALRGALAAMPDLVPSRPLRLLPAAEPARAGAAERLGGFVRRAFAPLMTAGAALALVGAVGTGAPLLAGGGDSGGATFDTLSAPGGAEADTPADGAGEPTRGVTTAEGEFDAGVDAPAATDHAFSAADDGEAAEEPRDGDEERQRLSSELPAERSPWPMVLFSGVALLVAVVGLRWILAPRAG